MFYQKHGNAEYENNLISFIYLKKAFADDMGSQNTDSERNFCSEQEP